MDTQAESETSECPSQWEINESVIIDGSKARHRGKTIAHEESEEELFEEIRRHLPDTLTGRIFSISDHGNVTEYNDMGEVIGSWV